ncbi:MAG: DUF2807 domain-containing protein [Cyclobacteriaceae bacterium]|nr:DUF2807 domain-containing protein [Cyclobacteriaceae bacterium]
MKNSGISILCTGFIILFYSSCNLNYKKGNGNIVEVEISVDDFQKVNIGGNYNVVLIQSDENKVSIETDENLHDFINTEGFNSTLNINNVHNRKSTEGIDVKIYYKELNQIYSSGASNIEHEGIIVSDKLDLILSGTGAVDLEVNTIHIEINLTGAGIVTLAGETDSLETHISGAGGLRAFELKTNYSNISVSGLGGAEVFVRERLEANITGIGGIIYAGNPKIIEKRITGLGKIKRADEYIDEENL